MYNFKSLNSNMFAISIPPAADAKLPENFKEISRIQFYLGTNSIKSMITAVKNASLDEIHIGKPQLYFAVKEMNNYLRSNVPDLNYPTKEPASYIDLAFQDILEHTLEVLNDAIARPSSVKNQIKIKTMLGLTHEVILVNNVLARQNIPIASIDQLITNIKEKYSKILKLKPHYASLQGLYSFNKYKEKAKDSLEEQLKNYIPYNVTEAKRIYSEKDEWSTTLSWLTKEKEQPYNEKETKEFKSKMIDLLTATEQLSSNGVINFINSYITAIAFSMHHAYTDVMSNPNSEYNNDIALTKRLNKRSYKSKKESKHELEELKANKDHYIQKIEDRKIDSDNTLKYRTKEYQTLTDYIKTIKQQVLNEKSSVEPAITFMDDTNTSFIIGKPTNNDFVVLVHKDPYVSVKNAVFAKIITTDDYNKLVSENNLIFTEDFKNSPDLHSSNFWSFGQFLNEINNPAIQDMFLKGQYKLIDQTVHAAPKEKLLKTVEVDIGDDIPF